jgi:hypothetical protein
MPGAGETPAVSVKSTEETMHICLRQVHLGQGLAPPASSRSVRCWQDENVLLACGWRGEDPAAEAQCREAVALAKLLQFLLQMSTV